MKKNAYFLVNHSFCVFRCVSGVKSMHRNWITSIVTEKYIYIYMYDTCIMCWDYTFHLFLFRSVLCTTTTVPFAKSNSHFKHCNVSNQWNHSNGCIETVLYHVFSHFSYEGKWCLVLLGSSALLAMTCYMVAKALA